MKRLLFLAVLLALPLRAQWTEVTGGQTAPSGIGVGGRVGANVAAATTITLSEFITSVTGSATITTINGLVSGRIYIVVPATGSTWQFATGGNIAQAVRPNEGEPLLIAKHGTSVRVMSKVVVPFHLGDANFNQGTQASRGATYRQQGFADGTDAAPISDVNPSWVTQRKDATDTTTPYIVDQRTFYKNGGRGFFYPFHVDIQQRSNQTTDAVGITSFMTCNPQSLPGTPVLTASAAGGSLATGTYRYRISAILANGAETVSGPEASVAVTGPNGSVSMTYTAVTGATGYRIYRTSSTAAVGSPTWTYYSDTASPFTDTNAAGTVSIGFVQTCYAMWGVLTKNVADTRGIGMEFDLNNNSGIDAGFPGVNPYGTEGVMVYGGGTAQNSQAYGVGFTGSGKVHVAYGISSGAVTDNALYFEGIAAMTAAGKFVLGGQTTPNTTLDVPGDVAWRRALVTLVNGNNNDVATFTNSFSKVTGPTAAFAITGITGGVDGKIIIVFNGTAQNMTISNANVASVAANRINTTTGADMVTVAQGTAMLIYDAGFPAWQVVSFEP